MTKVIDINDRLNNKRLRIVQINDEDREYDKLHAALSAAMHSLNAARNWSDFEKTHLLNCRDALDRAAFYLDDEIREKIDEE